ncbi:tyrosine--tRNA ligase [Candidatus Pacebacteria bacterium]|nr:tyrosine--tRNA ligase [Candidatus Paceibacterota bacterium]
MFGMGKSTKINTSEDDINRVLDRGSVSDVLPKKEDLKKILVSGKRLRFYAGFDATAPSLHLGHAQNLMLLEDFRKLGHEVIVLFGDFTAMIGDPTDKSAARVQLTKEQVNQNIKTWQSQVSSIVDFRDKKNPASIVKNSKWLSKLNFSDVIDLAANFTVQQMMERDMFDKRNKEGKPIYLQEFLYPLMQGYDSVSLDVDVEIGGTDQTFNMLTGRTLLKKYKNKEKFVIALNFVENPVTGVMMSKSKGTGIFLGTSANEMYGALLAQHDEMTEVFYERVTRLPLDKMEDYKKEGPKEFKMLVAKDIVKRFYGQVDSEKAEKNWEETFSKGGVPEDLETIEISSEKKLIDILIENKILKSKTEFRRFIESGAITNVDAEEKINDPNFVIEKDSTFKVGKKRFIKIKIKK